jgi:UDP:flavonoid glycosyltransferase YjiC (YdhE family)
MRVAIVVSGSRGDVGPMLALAVGLRAAGHDAVVCTSPDNEGWARSLGCVFEAVGEPLHGNESLGGWVTQAFNRFIRRQIELQVRDLPAMIEGCELVLASGLVWGVRSVAERLGIPYRYVAFTPAGFLGTTRDPIGTRISRGLAGLVADVLYGGALEKGRNALGLPRVRGVMRQLMGPATIAATDPDLTMLPNGARLLVTQTGYPLLAQAGELSGTLRRFLAAGPPPVYAGFGSMPVGDRERVARLLVDAAERAGQRLVVSRGWAGIPDVGSSDTRLFVDDEPHGLLFPGVSAVIHHGGAGTVATAARAGVPQIVLPQAADQFLWRGQVVGLGLGPRAPMLRLASAASLARAITAATAEPTYRQRAEEIAARLRAAPDGVAMNVAEITGTVRAGA